MRDLLLDGSLIVDSLWQPTLCLIIAITLASVFYKHIARTHITVLLLIAAAVLTPLLSAAFRFQGFGLITPTTITDPSSTSQTSIALLTQPNFLGSTANWDLIFAIFWAFLSTIMLLRLIRNAQQSRRFVNASIELENPTLKLLATKAAKKLQLKCQPQISRMVLRWHLWTRPMKSIV